MRELAAAAYGIATEYWDWQGRHVHVPPRHVVAVLAALDVDAGTTGGGRGPRWPTATTRPWRRMLPPCW